MKFYISIALTFVAYLLYGLYLSQKSLEVIPRELKTDNAPGYYDYRGVINVRTSLSRGSSSPQEVIQDAKAAGLDFLVLTDRNIYHSEGDSLNGYHGNLLVFNGAEYTFLDSRIFHIYFDPEKRPRSHQEANLISADLLSQRRDLQRDPLVMLANPFNPNPTWTGAYPPGLDGIEVLNPNAISQKSWLRSKVNVLWSILVYPFSSRYSFLRLFREPHEELALWDRLNQERPVIGFAGSEASATALPFSNVFLKFPSYQKSFEIFSNHVILNSELTGNPSKDRQKLFSAIRAGNFYMALDLLGNPKGFLASLHDKNKVYMMGSQVKFNINQKIKVQLPVEPKDFYEIIMIKDGRSVFLSNEPTLEFDIKEPGVYRVVVRVIPTLPLPDAKKWINWIYTNPFYVLE